jgi:uncharacterized membrane protein (UPF0182 family)
MTRKPIRPAQISIIILVVLALAFFAVTNFYTSVLWYQQLGFDQVLFTQIRAQVVLGLAAGLFAALVVGLNVFIANKMKPLYAKTSPVNDPLAAVRDSLAKARNLLLVAAPLVLGLFAGLAAAPKWQQALMFFNYTPSGKLDPEFKLDSSFYMLQLPFLGNVVSVSYTHLRAHETG